MMKRLLITLSLGFFLCACGGNSVRITSPCADAQKCADAIKKAQTPEEAAKAYELLKNTSKHMQKQRTRAKYLMMKPFSLWIASKRNQSFK